MFMQVEFEHKGKTYVARGFACEEPGRYDVFDIALISTRKGRHGVYVVSRRQVYRGQFIPTDHQKTLINIASNLMKECQNDQEI